LETINGVLVKIPFHRLAEKFFLQAIKDCVILGKVTRPILKGIFPRKRLFSMLDGMRERPIIWISGPAGAGDHLVSSYFEAANFPCLWYQM